MFNDFIEVMYFVPDRRAATEWYARLFDVGIFQEGDVPEHYYLQVGPVQVWFSAADEKVGAGTAGHIAYWRVDDFDAARLRAESLGGVVYRGPLYRSEDGLTMCQIRDPFGNLIGFVGPSVSRDRT